eukprot:Protomagalhaensia_wolfi_Nauph_80__4552@NODE_467_length_2471_cov_17_804276_g351_i0_p1_GENE_NODE_467_length_2471_cov_17_804276_g351_i0NODE_467_length_2471_cov_17_804276_g351_i0_p1_ORF_typecomplete_len610_score92_32UNC93/PF05978_16/8_9e14MFS_1/PF07690_16/0_00056Ost5/PF05251_12/7_7Ost5/PF05251_12/3_7e02Ost5/PF05251_12/6_8e03_NODE_467_length_2471_cov_17_804276_g351_i01061935
MVCMMSLAVSEMSWVRACPRVSWFRSACTVSWSSMGVATLVARARKKRRSLMRAACIEAGDEGLSFEHPLASRQLVPPHDPLLLPSAERVPLPWSVRASAQMGIFAVFCMCTVGPYNGLSGLGGGGMKDVLLVTRLNAFYSLSVAIFGWLGGVAFNYYGCRLVCTVAGCCYFIYILALTLISLAGAPGVIALPTGLMLGVGSSLLWAAFGVVSIRYPPPLKQARLFAVMWGLLNMGGLLCGLVSLVTNLGTHKANAGLGSYAGLMGAVACGTLIAAVGLRHQDHIIRTDGEPAGNDHEHQTIGQTFRHALEAVCDKRLLLLWPASLVPFVHHPFLFNGMNAQYFNIRSRSLNSSLYWGSRVPGGILFYFACRQPAKYTKPGSTAAVKKCLARRLMPGYYLTFAWSAAALACSYFAIFDTFGILPPPSSNTDLLDFNHSYPRALLGIIPFVAFGVLDSLIQSLLYNLLGAMAGEDSGRAAVFSGLYKTLQSVMVAGMWAMDWLMMQYGPEEFPFRYKFQWMVMCFFWIVAFPGTLITLLRLRKMPEHFVYQQPPQIQEPMKNTRSPGDVSTIVSSVGNVICLAHMRGDYPMTQPNRVKLTQVLSTSDPGL